MKAKVFFASAVCNKGISLPEKMNKLFDESGISSIISPKDLVAIKLHVGEPGNLSFVPPQLVRKVVDKVKRAFGVPFLTDANTLYAGRRDHAVNHMMSAIENGFGADVTGAPFIVADGLRGKDYVNVPVHAELLKEAKIGSAVIEADALIVLSHFKGHQISGFGGAIKNLGMGAASRAGKQIQHSDVVPSINKNKCTGCGTCIKYCPEKAIKVVEKVAIIDSKLCIGCGECMVSCRYKAVKINWDEGAPGTMQKKMAEYTKAAVTGKENKTAYINVAIRISPDCDCFACNDVPVVSDIGIFASFDAVAIDQACADMVIKAAGAHGGLGDGMPVNSDKFMKIHQNVDWRDQLAHGEKIVLGTREYELIEID